MAIASFAALQGLLQLPWHEPMLSARLASLTQLERAPCKGAISQWETDPPGNFRSGR
jgi:hypothetical protein